MVRKNRMIIGLLLICILSFTMFTTAYAHAAIAESQGGTLVKFMFSDGTSAKGARIIVYDANHEQIGKGKVDNEGMFDYAEYVGTAAELYMNDGEGHSVTYTIPAEAAEAAPAVETEAVETESESGISVGTIVACVIGLIAVIAIIILVLKRKKNSSN